MESSWRQNVPDLGLADGFIRLAARVRVLPSEFLIVAFDEGSGRYGLMQRFAGTQEWYIAGTSPIMPEDPHFPYGWDVLPDEPM